jgi:hypothetical protein
MMGKQTYTTKDRQLDTCCCASYSILPVRMSNTETDTTQVPVLKSYSYASLTQQTSSSTSTINILLPKTLVRNAAISTGRVQSTCPVECRGEKRARM